MASTQQDSSGSSTETSLAARFVSLWNNASDDSPDVFEFLRDNPPDNARESGDVVMVDQQERYVRGIALPPDDYFQAIPSAAADEDVMLEVILRDVKLRCESGIEVDTQELLTHYPNLTDQLAEQLTDSAAGNHSEAATDATSDWDGDKKTDDQVRTEVYAKSRTRTTSPMQHKFPATIGRYSVKDILGKGGFGLVYLAYDDVLKRNVAIKVPHPDLISGPEDVKRYISEAQVLAKLDHPGIVPVYDVGRGEGDSCFIVSKFIEGVSLRDRMRDEPVSQVETARLIATIAEALAYAHKRKLVHRDVKPANIIIDTEGDPIVIDFGLALREEEFGKVASMSGTPAYMSPEQACGEGHLVDGRSDQFSLGVSMFEMLTGTQPFRGRNRIEVLEEIKHLELESVDAPNKTVFRELERICLKSLSKRAKDRYPTCQEMADDLRHFLARFDDESNAATQLRSEEEKQAESRSLTFEIVPKGLRAFDADDAPYFLNLLPGARDRDGLPESIHFWKSRIEQTDPAQTFRVGLIYGPSGCGKSSLVKAGLFPHLESNIVKIYVESTPVDTERRILDSLARHCQGIHRNDNLAATIAAIRRGSILPKGEKVVLVLDQFEQWLFAQHDYEEAPLVQALRQCDGEHVQCVLMVRDDFWLAVSRLMNELEIDLIAGANMALVDLFDGQHAKRVLTALGAAYQRLPKDGKLSKDQESFLDRVVDSLSENGKVVSVRLSLFAEMIKDKPWTAATLKQLGGTEGVGVTFLEETFSASTAPPQNQQHQQAARNVLGSLLPTRGTNIKGAMQSQEELMRASGYEHRIADFDRLIRLLDSELRLITPTDPAGNIVNEVGEADQTSTPATFYQLTHDYLVPSLREWLTKKQRETVSGRAELRLQERGELWNAKPEKRHLPSASEWVRISLFTKKRSWTDSQRRMMRKATMQHSIRATAVLVLLMLVGWGSYEVVGRSKAATLVENLKTAEVTQVREVVVQLPPYRRWANPKLRSMCENSADKSREKLHASLALLPVDREQAQFLKKRVLDADPETLLVIQDALTRYRQDVTPWLWQQLDNEKLEPQKRFRAALALAGLDPPRQGEDVSRWDKHAQFVTDNLVDGALAKPSHYMPLVDALRPARIVSLRPLHEIYNSEDIIRRKMATGILSEYAAGYPGVLAQLVMDADEGQFKQMLPLLQVFPQEAVELMEHGIEQPVDENSVSHQDAAPSRQANAAVALLLLREPDNVWPLLGKRPDQGARSFLIHRIQPQNAAADQLVARLKVETDVWTRQALLLALGDYGSQQLPVSERKALVPLLEQWYLNDPHPGIHSAAEWLLRKWEQNDVLSKIPENAGDYGRDSAGDGAGDRKWYVSNEGYTMAVVDGSRVGLGRLYEIATKEVTLDQYLKFDFRKWAPPDTTPSEDCAVGVVKWFDAIKYCQWLDEQEGILEDQSCYPPESEWGDGILPVADVTKTGYRLPTVEEWRYACWNGAATSRFYGDDPELAYSYAWCKRNSQFRAWPGGLLKPNDFGLYDVLGNLSEWCADTRNGQATLFQGAFTSNDPIVIEQSAVPNTKFNTYGFRVARTRRVIED